MRNRAVTLVMLVVLWTPTLVAQAPAAKSIDRIRRRQ